MNFAKVLPILAIVLIAACTQQGSGGGGGNVSVSLSYPMGGESFDGGNKLTIRYDSPGADHYQIYFTSNPDFSCDSSNGWTIIKNHPYYEKTFEYTLPYQNTQTARVRVEAHSATHETLGYRCSGLFAIKA